MKKRSTLKDVAILSAILSVCFILCLVIMYTLNETTLIPAVFILGVFLISIMTRNYTYGITSSLISIVAVNVAYNFNIPTNIILVAIMLLVAIVTCSFTTKVKMQETLKSERDRERMSANLLRAVSHDLRTPLTTIYGSGCALIDNYNEFNEEQKKKILEGIKEDSLWLSRMVENLLSITKLGASNVKITKVDTVLDELIDSILVKFAKRYPHWKVDINIPEEFVVIPMDALLIEQVAINILENAVQHAEGMTKLTLKVTIVKDKAIFEIQDDGCGIPEEKIKKLFTGVYLEQSGVSDRKKNNAGIGLSVCASIIKAHGGEIKVHNLKGGGSVFRFTLHMEESGNE